MKMMDFVIGLNGPVFAVGLENSYTVLFFFFFKDQSGEKIRQKTIAEMQC